MKHFYILSVEGFEAFEQHFQELGLEFTYAKLEPHRHFIVGIEVVKGVVFEFSCGLVTDDKTVYVMYVNYFLTWPQEGFEGLCSHWRNNNCGVTVDANNRISAEEFVTFLENFARERSALCR